MNTKKISIIKVVAFGLLCIGFVVTMYPLIYAFFGSFKNNIEFLAGGANMLPEKWDVSNYTYAWKEADFARYTLNSLFISISCAVLTAIVASMAGYVLARAEFRGKELISGTIGLVMFIPSVVLIFPIFKLCQAIGLSNTLWSMIIPQVATGLPFSTMLISSYIRAISREIDEAASIDGCSFFGIYWSMMMPLSVPILATSALIAFKNSWNSYLLPMALSLSNKLIRPLTVGVIALKDAGEGISAWNIMLAGSIMAIIPIIVVYIFLNRYFIAGMTAGAVKG